MEKILLNRYRNILQRCNNPNSRGYKDYWWRGIKCEWKTFEEFYTDMKEWFDPVLSIDRINNDWNYCKKNCRWADRKTQINNRRKQIRWYEKDPSLWTNIEKSKYEWKKYFLERKKKNMQKNIVWVNNTKKI